LASEHVPAPHETAHLHYARSAEPHDHLKLWPWFGVAALAALAASGTVLTMRMSDSANLEHAPPSSRLALYQAAQGRARWLTGAGIALGVLGTASLAGAIINFMTLRSSQESDAWTCRFGMGRVTLTRRFF
jgi:hypothetical protein